MIRIKDDSVECLLHWHLAGLLFSLPAKQRWTVTSGSETSAEHGRTSLHYALPGCAVDLRLASWPEDQNLPLSIAVNTEQFQALDATIDRYCARHNLPRVWFDVVREKTHIHLEFQPKRSITDGQ